MRKGTSVVIILAAILASMFLGSGIAGAQPKDIAPLPDDVVAAVTARYRGGNIDVEELAFNKTVSGTLDVLNQVGTALSSGATLPRQVSTHRMLVEGKLRELETAYEDLQKELDAIRKQIKKRGQQKELKDWLRFEQTVIKRHEEIQRNIAAVVEGKSVAEKQQALAKATKLLQTILEASNPPERNDLTPPSKPGFQDDDHPAIKPTEKDGAPPAYASLNQTMRMFASADTQVAEYLPPAVLPTVADSCGWTAADLAATLEVQKDDPEISALAASLGYSPVNIFKYVSNKYQYEPYFGSLKGSKGTLVSGAGNATDKASLLIALLRAANIPARYVRGEIGLRTNQVQNWLGVKSLAGANAVLADGFIPHSLWSDIGATVVHVWVEACVPYSNYRGIGNENAGYRWIPLDPSYEQREYQAGISVNAPFDFQGYLSKKTNLLPQEQYQQTVSEAIKALPPNYANNTLNDVPYVGKKVEQLLDILPASLPYEVLSYKPWEGSASSEASTLPDAHRIQFHITFNNESPVSFSMPEIALSRVTLSFQGATQSDLTAIYAWKHNDQQDMPCTTVINVRPTIKVDGIVKFSGVNNVGLCTKQHHLDMSLDIVIESKKYVINPASLAKFDNIAAANYHSLNINAFQISDRMLSERAARLTEAVRSYPDPSLAEDETIGEFLYLSGLKYYRHVDESTKTIGRLAGSTGLPGNYLGLTSTAVKVKYAFGLPFSISTQSLIIDVPAAIARSYDLVTGNLNSEVFKLEGWSASAYEAYIWQENARMDAISTISGLQLANELVPKIPIVTLSNWATDSSKLQVEQTAGQCATTLVYCPATITMFKAKVDAGYVLTLPASQLQRHNWKGYVYIEEKVSSNTITLTYGILGDYHGGYAAGLASFMYDSVRNSNFVTERPASPPAPACGMCYTGVEAAAIIPSPISGNGNGQGSLAVTYGDPVNMVTGNMYYTERDFTLKGRGGLPIVLERSYNSRSNANGAFGYGWTHSFNQYLTFTTGTGTSGEIISKVEWTDGTGNVKYIKETSWAETSCVLPPLMGGGSGGGPGGLGGPGGGARHCPIIPVTFEAPDGFYFRVLPRTSTSTTTTIVEKDGTSYVFGYAAGTIGEVAKLISITDPNGNKLGLNYDATRSKLLSVTDGLGRALTFVYYPNSNRVQEVLDWTGRKVVYQYDTAGNLISVEDPLAVAGKHRQASYDYYTTADHAALDHKMKRYTLPEGESMTFEYYLNSKVFRHYNSAGETTTFSYNEFRRETIAVNERGFTRRWFFNPNTLPVKVVDEQGNITEYAYENTNDPMLMTKQRDVLGYDTFYAFDLSGNLTKTTNPSGSTVEYSYYNNFGQAQKVKDANGNYTLRRYDAKGNQTEVIAFKNGIGAAINPATYVTSATDIVAWTITGYDSFGNVASVKNVRDFATKEGPTVTYNYTDTVNNVTGLNPVGITRCGDKNGNKIMTDDACDVASQAFDALGQMKTGIRGDWYPVSLTYDAVGRVTRGTDSQGELRDYIYDGNGRPVEQKLEKTINNVMQVLDRSTTRYNSAGRRETVTDSAGSVTHLEYDAVGNIVKTTNADGYNVGFGYDATNHWVIAYDEEGHFISRQLDALGKPRSVTDPNGNTVTFEYYGPEKDGRLKNKKDAAGRITEFDYNANGSVTRVTERGYGSASRETLSYYDEVNRPVRIVQPTVKQNGVDVRPVSKYIYDTLGHQTEVWAGYTTDLAGASTASDVLSKQVSYVYDDFGRKLKETDPLGHTWAVNEYDLFGNPRQITDAKGQVKKLNYRYGGVVERREAYASAADTSPHVTTYLYNALGQVEELTAPEVKYTYGYDAAHRLNRVTDSRGNKTINYDYSAGGLLNSMTDSDGRKVNYLYDPVRRLTGIWAANGDIVTYLYDTGGRITEKWFPNGSNTRYSYNTDNSLKRLENRVLSGTTVSAHDYTYNEFGLRDSQQDQINGVTTKLNFGFDGLSRLEQVRDASNSVLESYGYDMFGNRRTRTAGSNTLAYLYNSAQQLNEIRQGSDTGPVQASFNYDLNGNMTGKTEGASVLSLTYDALDRMTKAEKTGQPTELYTYGPQGARLAKTVGSATANYLYSGPDIVAEYGASWSQANVAYTHGPFMDDPLIRVTSTQTAYYHQDGLGSIVAMTSGAGAVLGTQRFDSWGNVAASSGTIPQYGYTGREPDATGLIYYRARYYDPSVGRFTQTDPLGFIDGVNRYVYAVNNPVNFIDPWGQSIQTPSAGDPGACTLMICHNNGSTTQSDFYSGPDVSMELAKPVLVMEMGVVGGIVAAPLGASGAALVETQFAIATDSPVIGPIGGASAAASNAAKVELSTAQQSGILRDAASGKGNFGLGQATAAESNAMGSAWVGPNSRVASDGKTLVSSDGLSTYRPPSPKDSPYATTGVQANFERLEMVNGRPSVISNGHLDITP